MAKRKFNNPLGECVKVEERFQCPRCNEPIRPDHVHGRQLVEEQTHRTRREIRVLCDRCNGAFRSMCGYDAAGHLMQLGPAEEITDTVERGSFISFVNQQRVDVAVAG